MTWWVWLLIVWVGLICLVGPFIGRTLRRIDEIEWTVPVEDPSAPAPAPAATRARTPAASPAPTAEDLVA
ncbi:hypothetical protein [Modestobacter sp. SYSU DS0657]